MSQRTRAHTTADATARRNNKSTSQAEPAHATPALQTPPAPQPGDGQRAGQAAPPAQQATATESTFAPETLARTLRAVAAELERDPALAQRLARAVADPQSPPPHSPTATPTADAPSGAPEQPVETPAKGKRATRTFRPRLVTGLSPDLGQGVIDPFALYATRGEDGLRAALGELRLGSLRAMIREHHLDPSGKLAQQNDAEKLRAAILTAATKKRR